MKLHFGFVPIVIISSKQAAEEVLKTHDLDCCSRPETVATKKISYNFKDIGFAPYGEEWRSLRKLAVMELLNLKKLNSFRYIREEENDLFVKKLSEASKKHSPVNLTKSLFTFIASIVCRLAFGQNLHESEFIDEDGMEELASRSEKLQGEFAFSNYFPGGLLNLIYFFDWVLPEGTTVKDIDMDEEGALIIGKKVPLELVPMRQH
ncbi:hypothetical protein Bca52824_071387 [Brassica carinata]|uniref:Uncharacterized protein n=1 Tax=Brassica carinata TaxID=52824 RepID=A0A8X7Q730_BRACI|nr:hypothetical protein Bca52824_071387 [Brassica carinata]